MDPYGLVMSKRESWAKFTVILLILVQARYAETVVLSSVRLDVAPRSPCLSRLHTPSRQSFSSRQHLAKFNLVQTSPVTSSLPEKTSLSYRTGMSAYVSPPWTSASSMMSRSGFLKGTMLQLMTISSLSSSCIDTEVPANGGYVSECMKKAVQDFTFEDGGIVSLNQGWDGRPGHTGVSVWQSSKALAAYMDELGPEFWTGLRVIELGSGAGLGSLTAYHLGAGEVLATDGNADVLKLVQNNIQRNARSIRREPGVAESSQSPALIRALPLKWGETLPSEVAQGEWDVIIGSDLTYNGQVWIQLADTVSQLLDTNSNNNAKFLYCSAAHSQFGAELDGFQTIAETKGLRWEKEVEFRIPGSDRSATIIWISKS